MNKIVIIALLTLPLFNNVTSAQIIGGYGVKAGILVNGLRSSNNAPANLQDSSSFNFFGYDLGIYAELFPAKKFNLTTEFHFTLLGEQPSNLVRLLTKVPSNQGEFYEYKYASNRFTYISFHLLPHYNFVNNPDERLFILAGPRFDMMLSNYNSEYEENLKLNNGNLETGAILGFGGEFKNVFNFEFRYNYNFSEIYSVKYGTEKISRKHHSFIFFGGLNLKKLFK